LSPFRGLGFLHILNQKGHPRSPTYPTPSTGSNAVLQCKLCRAQPASELFGGVHLLLTNRTCTDPCGISMISGARGKICSPARLPGPLTLLLSAAEQPSFQNPPTLLPRIPAIKQSPPQTHADTLLSCWGQFVTWAWITYAQHSGSPWSILQLLVHHQLLPQVQMNQPESAETLVCTCVNMPAQYKRLKVVYKVATLYSQTIL
jgi:hypothetical protein